MLFKEGIKEIGVKWTYTTASCIQMKSHVLIHLSHIIIFKILSHMLFTTLLLFSQRHALYTHTHFPTELNSVL